MIRKGSKLYSIWFLKCPKCHEGNLFEDKRMWKLRTLGKMPQNCPACGEAYTPEPGFYFGAAYVSYGISLIVALLVLLVCWLFFDLPGRTILILVSLGIIICAPLSMMLSRAVWLNIFVKYDPQKAKKVLGKK